MSFTEPSKEGFTIYTKSGCPNCTKVKHLFKEKNISGFKNGLYFKETCFVDSLLFS